jgi:hypothetical protein
MFRFGIFCRQWEPPHNDESDRLLCTHAVQHRDPTDEKYISRGTHGLGMQRLMINCNGVE